MRRLLSYGLALVIIVVLGLWLASGTLVIPGNGPGNGEAPVLGASTVTPPTADQQALLDVAKAKELAAAEAKKAADAAAAEAKKAADAANAADTAGLTREEELKKEAEAKAEAARTAKAALDTATAAAAAAEAAAVAAQDAVDAFKPISERNQTETAGVAAEPRSVRIATYTMKAMPIEVPLRGRTKAKAQVSVVPETSGVVRDVAVQKGQKVAAGDLMCTLDPGTRAAAVAQAQAALDQARTAFETNTSLRAKGLASENSVGPAEAALKGAQAALDNAKAELARTEVRAKVSGVVQEPLASVGALLSPGAPCATIVELDPMLFVGNVPEAKIGYAKLGLPAVVETVTGARLEGKVTYISDIADAATRSFAVEIELPNADGSVRDGLTAQATVNVGTAPGHLLPQSVLTLDDDGEIGVRAVIDSKVAFFPVTILRDTREGVWVSGLPPKVDVITVGQEYVQAGQVVKAGYGPEKTETAQNTGTPS